MPDATDLRGQPFLRFVLAAMILALPLLARAAQPPTEGGNVAEADDREGPWTTQNGFFFFKGTYVSPPYTITVDEDGEKINGIIIMHADRRPTTSPAPDKDPGPFNWTQERKAQGLHKSGFMRHAILRFHYWQAEFGYDEACARFERYLRDQPLVARVARGAPGDFGLYYWTHDGEKRGIGFSRPAAPLTPAEKKRKSAEQQERYEEAAEGTHRKLASGGALFYGRGSVFLPGARARRSLPRIYEVAASTTMPSEKKVAALVGENLIPVPRIAEAFVEGFSDCPSLKSRIKEIEAHKNN
jgi:hypothetical protein